MVSWGVDAGIRSLPYAPVFAAVCTDVVQITQRLHPNGNSRKLKRTGVFTSLFGVVLFSFGAKGAF